MSGGIGGGSSPVTAGGAGGRIDQNTGAANAGSTPTEQASRGGGGGGGSAGGGAGGAGQTTFTTGASLNMPMQQLGGSGGAGGADFLAPEAATGSNAMSGTGGAGTLGQPGTAPRNYSTDTPAQDYIGGGGGEGGYGLILTGNGSFTNTGALTGGTGGAGGFDTSGSGNAVSGEGGDGGIAIDILGTNVTLTNTAALTGGNAGAGSVSSFNGSGITTTYGTGGAAIAGHGLTISDTGNLNGGLNGDGSQGAAIDFTGGANALYIANGTTVIGGIIDIGSLALESASQSDATYSGISGSGSVDIASNNSVYLLGANTYAGGTTVDGNLSLGNGATTGTLAGPLTIDSGGSLDLYLPASSSATLDAVSGSGVFFIEPTSSVTIVSDNLTAGSGFSGTNNFGTLTIEGGTASGNIQNGGTLNLAQTGATPLTISGVISDLNGEGGPVVGTVVATSGTTILSGANTYSGNTDLKGGIIDAENASAFGTGTVYAFDPEIDYGPASGSTATSATQTNGIVLDSANDPTTLKVAGMFTETISGDITTGTDMNAVANQQLVVDGAGTLVLSGANTFSGGIMLGGSGTLELDSTSAAGANGGTGTNGAVTFATGSTAALKIDQAALSSMTYSYADPISNFAYGESIDLPGFAYRASDDAMTATTATLTNGDLSVSNAGNDALVNLTNFADAHGQSGMFTTAADGNGGTLVTLTAPPPPPPAAPTYLAESGTATNGGTVTITGIATGAGDAGDDTITLYADSGTTAVGTGPVTNGVFDITTTTPFLDGTHDFTATDTSVATGETSANSGGSTLYSFTGGTDGSSPQGSLFADAAGNLIGTTYQGGTGYGTVFEIANTSGSASAPVYAGSPTTLYSFTATGLDGGEPDSGMIADANGDLFGTTAASGYNNNINNGPGTVFEVLNTGTTAAPAYAKGAATLYPIGGGLNAGLAIDAAGDLFGTTSYGGESGNGTVFEIANTSGSAIAPAYGNAPTTLYSFTGQGTDGATPGAGLIVDAAGNLYGTTAFSGASGNGTVFEIANTSGSANAPAYANAPTTLYSFTGGNDGANPQAGLIADAAGNIIGTTSYGGANGGGTVFEIAKTANGYAATPTTLASFGQNVYPASLVTDAAGNLYGTTQQGGANGNGTVFEIANNGTVSAPAYASTATTLESFTGRNDGGNPAAGLLAIAGGLYGTTSYGGISSHGTVFETIPTGIAPVLITAVAPTLTAVSGTASNGGTLTVTGNTPDAAYDTVALYSGTTVVGTGYVQPGSNGTNSFSINTNGLADGTYSFTATDTSADGTTTSPVSTPLAATVAALAPTGLHQVGTTANGGTVTIAGSALDATGDTITLYANGGTTAVGSGTVAADGTFTATAVLPDGSYAITATDTSRDGTVTSPLSNALTSTTLASLYSFAGGNDGGSPVAGLIADAAGDLFGTTQYGGANGNGTVFEIANTGTAAAPVYATAPTTLVSFNGTDGSAPSAGLVGDAKGDLFGTTDGGGANDGGTVFEIANTGTATAPVYVAPTTLVSFNETDGAVPQAGLFVDGAGNLIGTTSQSANMAPGGVFEIANTSGSASSPTYANTPIVLHTFMGGSTDGSTPTAGLVADANGDLFGTTNRGGANNDGTVFEIANTSGSAQLPTYGAATTLYSFTGHGTDGSQPFVGLVADAAGDLFGVTAGGGGAYNDGTIFEIAKTNGTYASTPTTLYSFTGQGGDGGDPDAALIADAAGDLYGTTSYGGAHNEGTIFELVKTNGSFAATPVVLHAFDGTDGSNPQASLLLAANGTLYGTTANGGTADGDHGGTVFALTSQANQPTAIVTATAPTGLAQKGIATPGNPIEITGTGDANGDTITLYNGTTVVGSGTAGTGGAFDITTTADFAAGSYTLTAIDTSHDGTQVSAMSAGVTATVTAGTPTANAQSDAVAFNTATAITLSGSDPDSPALPLTYTIATGPSHGTLSGSGADETYTPTAGYQGADSFTFTDSNGTNTSTPATVSLTVAPPPLVITSPAAGSSVSIIDPAISGSAGTANAGSTVTLTSGQTVLGSTIVASDGSWSDHVTLPSDGSYTIVATDTAGGVNQGSASDTFTLNSLPNQSLFSTLTHDVTSVGGQIYALYETILGRAPDPLGYEGWVSTLAAGTPLATIAQDFLSSGEYLSEYGSSVQSDSGYVAQLYQNGLHRTAGANEIAFWDNQIASGLSLAQVATDIATSQESQNDLAPTFQTGVFVPSTTDSAVARLYYGLLHRAPDAAGLQNSENAVASGTSLAALTQNFLASAEYAKTTAGQDNLNYVAGLYQTALGRSGSASELQSYQLALDTGSATRTNVANDFLESTEFQNDEAGQTNSTYVNAVYQAALGRQAEAGGLQAWDNALASGTSRAIVAQDIVGSAEFAAKVTAPAQTAFVNALYEGALGRGGGANDAGAQGWVGALNSGASQPSVALSITQSPEAVAHLSPAIETGFNIA